MWQEYIEQWRKQRAKEEEELKKLKDRQVKKKMIALYGWKKIYGGGVRRKISLQYDSRYR